MNNQYLGRMQELLGDAYPEYEASLKQPAYRGFRINPLKTDDSSFFVETNWQKKPIPFAKHAYYFNENITVGHSYEYLAGLIYMQEPSAMAPVEVLDPKPGENILDLCAAPGSKTTQIIERMNHQGVVVANEIDTQRAQILKENIVRSGATNVIITNASPNDIQDAFPSYFDAILVDAPCSGEGMFRKEEQASKDWSVDHVLSCAKRQSKILDSAYEALKGNGRLVYSTCTFSLEENEKTIEAFVKRHPDMEILPIQATFGVAGQETSENTHYARRIYPMQMGEGQFICLMKKKGETLEFQPSVLKSERIPSGLLEEIHHLSKNEFPYYFFYKNKLYGGQVPFLSTSKCRLIRHQCYIGEWKKNYFEYAHDYFMNAFSDFYHIISCDSTQIDSFLHGEAIKYNLEKGIYPIGWQNHILGFVKSDGQYLKNKYPKGLRLK